MREYAESRTKCQGCFLNINTIEVVHNGRVERIRLNGIDYPEKHQPFSQKAKQFTSVLVFRREVPVQPITKDRHRRAVGDGNSVTQKRRSTFL